MPDVPDGISLERHRDLRGRERGLYVRWVLLGVIGILPVLALLNVFGQRPTSTTVDGSTASLSVTAPAHLRSGLIFQVRVEVIAHRDLHELEIAFDRGWWESMSVNSIVPEPSKSNFQNGQVVLSYGKLEAGQKLIAWVYCQVNPTNVGERRENVEIDDNGTPLVHLHRSLTVFP
jgi:hypothetical protein